MVSLLLKKGLSSSFWHHAEGCASMGQLLCFVIIIWYFRTYVALAYVACFTQDNIGVFVDQHGKLGQEGRICWSEAPCQIVMHEPYAIGLLPRHVEVS